MRYHSLTKSLFCTLLCFGLLSLAGAAFAQVYKSYDANGNVVFSDKPSQRSEEVEISNPNVTDAFEIPPPPAPADTSLETEPAAPEPEPEPPPETQPIADEDSADTNNDGRISRREKEEFREEQRRKRREMKEPSGWYSE
jgi:hypothetical protein